MTNDRNVKRGWPWTRVLLVVSLTLNLAVAGMVIGASIGHRHGGDRPDRVFGGGMRPYVAALPEDQRRKVRDRLIRDRDTARAARQDLRNAARHVHAVIAAETFEPAELRAAFAAQRAIYDALAANGHEALVEIVAGMSPRDRAQFMENLKSFRRGP